VVMMLNESVASCLCFGAADCAEVSDTLQDDWDTDKWPLGHVPLMLHNLIRQYLPEGAAGKTVCKDELKKIVWENTMKPYTLKDKFDGFWSSSTPIVVMC
jgi:hypothetical protein